MTSLSPRSRRSRKRATVDQYMTRSPHTIDVEETLERAHAIMREHEIRHLPVLREGALVGIVSLGDLHLVETLRAVSVDEVTIEEAMTAMPFVVTSMTPVEDAAREMARHKYGSAVVVDDGEIVGIFTSVNALEALAWLLERYAD